MKMSRMQRFIKNKRVGWYVSVLSLILGLITLIAYVARGGNYLSPVSTVAVVLLVLAIITNALCLIIDFRLGAFVPMILYSCVVAVLLNTEMLFITNVLFGVDGNSFDAAFYTFVICAISAMITSAVAFALGLSKSNKIFGELKPEEQTSTSD